MTEYRPSLFRRLVLRAHESSTAAQGQNAQDTFSFGAIWLLLLLVGGVAGSLTFPLFGFFVDMAIWVAIPVLVNWAGARWLHALRCEKFGRNASKMSTGNALSTAFFAWIGPLLVVSFLSTEEWSGWSVGLGLVGLLFCVSAALQIRGYLTQE